MSGWDRPARPSCPAVRLSRDVQVVHQVRTGRATQRSSTLTRRQTSLARAIGSPMTSFGHSWNSWSTPLKSSVVWRSTEAHSTGGNSATAWCNTLSYKKPSDSASKKRNWSRYHAFVVFETEFWWWSIEKNDAGITLQRSKRKNSVLYEYRRESRVKPITLVMTAKGRGSVSDLVDLLWTQDHLNRTYHFLLENCKYFAAAVFNQTNSEGKECVVGILDGRPPDLL